MTDDSATRHRTISWSTIDVVKVHAIKEDYLQGWADGRYPQPPICDTLNFKLTEVARGRAVFVCSPGEFHYNPMGTVHGGLLSTLIDSACGIACMSLLPHGTRWTTVNLSISFLRMATEATGALRCVGTAVHEGQRIVVVDAIVTAPDGEAIASGRGTCMTLAASRSG